MRYLFIFVFLLAGCIADTTPQEPAAVTSESLLGGASAASVLRGRELFRHEEMGGNGRTCESCHTTVERAIDVGYRRGRQLGLSKPQAALMGLDFAQRFATFDLAPEFARELFALDPNDGLFREIDSDGGNSNSYEMVQQGLIRIPMTLHPRVSVVGCGAPGSDCEVLPNGQHRIIVLRSPPTTLNTIIQEVDANAPGRPGMLMWDARESDAVTQAGSAFNDHFERTQTPTLQQQEDLAAFQRNTFTDVASAYYAATGVDPGLPACTTPSECRGREFFIEQPILASDMEHRGLCAQCHSGPALNRSGIFHRLQPPVPPVANVCPCQDGTMPVAGSCGLSVPMEGPVATPIGAMCLHRISAPNADPPGRPGFIDRTFVWTDVPGWGTRVMQGHDPGRGGITGDPCSELTLQCLVASANPADPSQGGGVLVPMFRIASIRGAGRRTHFDHSNVALTHREQVDDVAEGFAAFVPLFQSQGDPNALAFIMSEQDRIDCAAYMKRL